MRSAEGISTRSSLPRENFLLRSVGEVSTSSPGSTKGMNRVVPSLCASPSPPYTSFSIFTRMEGSPPARLFQIIQAEPREAECFEQPLLNVLTLNQRQLRRGHFSSVGRERLVHFAPGAEHLLGLRRRSQRRR